MWSAGLTKLKTFFRVVEAWCHCTFRKMTQSSMWVIKSPSHPCGSANLPLAVSCVGHQISQSPVQFIKSLSLPCRSPNLPVSRAAHQISQSPMQLSKSPSLPCRSSNLLVSHAGHQISQIQMKALTLAEFLPLTLLFGVQKVKLAISQISMFLG